LNRKPRSNGAKVLLTLVLIALIGVNIYLILPGLTGLSLPFGGGSPNEKPETSQPPVSSSVDRFDVLSQMNAGFGENYVSTGQSAPSPFELGVCRVNVYCCDSYRFYPLSGSAVTWTSSDENIATVDETGLVRTFHAGEAIITATDAAGNTDSCTINVIKVAYITIDDTPTEYTMKLLDILDQYGVKATFFMNAAPKQKDLYKEIYDRGHSFALHGYSHKTKYADGAAFLANMEKCRTFLMETTGCEYVDNVFRFPTGSKGQDGYRKILDYMHQQDYVAFDWSTEFHDYYYHTASGCLEYFKKYLDDNYANRSSDYAVVLFHPREWSVEALPDALDYIIKQGYSFATVTRDTAEYNFYKTYCDE